MELTAIGIVVPGVPVIGTVVDRPVQLTLLIPLDMVVSADGAMIVFPPGEIPMLIFDTEALAKTLRVHVQREV